MRNKEYNILYSKYIKLINDPSWIATEPIRKFLDNIKIKLKMDRTKYDSVLFDDAFESLLFNYDKLLNSKFWIFTSIFRRKKKIIQSKQDSNELVLTNNDSYQSWIEKHEKDTEYIDEFEYCPLFSIIVPVFNVKSKYLLECLDSIRKQVYINYEVIIVDDKSTLQETVDCLKELESRDNVSIIYKDKNEGISEATNVGLRKANGDFVVFLDNDDTLSKNALYEIVKSLNQDSSTDVFYSDEDKINETGDVRFMPRFKPNYSPDLILNNNYFCHLLVIRKKLCDEVGEMNSSFNGVQDYDYILRCLERTNPSKIVHINKVLYHWRTIKGSTSLNINEKDEINSITHTVKQETINRRGLNAYIEDDENVYYISDNRMISVIIPSKDNFDTLLKCINAILYKITYENYEIIIVDNGSSEENKEKITEYISKYDFIKYVYHKMEFNFSVSCSIGVENSKGDYLLFLNDDVEIIYGDLFDKLAGYARQEHVGAVGTKLLYPDSLLIQHCGIVNSFPGPSHYLEGYDDTFNYRESFNKINVDVFGVTGACLMIEKTKYLEIGGFDIEFSNDYNDVDLCIRLLKRNYYNVCLNGIYSYHHESMTRTIIDQREILKRALALYTKHPDYYLLDRYYSENFKMSTNDFEY